MVIKTGIQCKWLQDRVLEEGGCGMLIEYWRWEGVECCVGCPWVISNVKWWEGNLHETCNESTVMAVHEKPK